MIPRVLLFAVYAFLGAVLSYGLGDETVRAPGAAIVAVAVVSYALAGRARCARVA